MSRTFMFLVMLAGFAIAAAGCGDSYSPSSPTDASDASDAEKAATLAVDNKAGVNPGGFRHGLTIMLDGKAYFLAGAPDGPDGATDIPGHEWVLSGSKRLQGKHYNTGPFGAESWWSSDAPDGALLYKVNAIIDTWSKHLAMTYGDRGFLHYHELVRVADGEPHPTMVIWLQHIAVRHFNLDGGPHPELAHEVSPGLDSEFIPNGMMPYRP